MNNTNTKLILLLSFLICIIFSIYAQKAEQGIPGFKNYSPKDYQQESQNFSVIQDQNQLMYFGNSNGIMEFDNTTWRIVKVTGMPVMDINSNNEIFFGGYNQLGQLTHKNGHPYAKQFDIFEEIKPGQIEKIVAFDSIVFFTSSHQLLIYQNDTTILEQSNAIGIDIYKQNDRLLIYIPNRGLYYWHNNIIIKHEDFELFKNINIAEIIPLNNQDFIIKPTDELGFYKYINGEISKFNTDIDAFIQSNDYSKALLFNNNQLIVGTRHGGLACINLNGDYIYSINRDNGLRDNQITDLFIDINQRLWVTSFNGIMLVETNSQISFFSSSFGFSGAVLSIYRYNGILYVGTPNGLFRYFEGDIYDSKRNIFEFRYRFVKVEGIQAACWELNEINNNLYVISGAGVFQVQDNKAKLVLEGQYNTIKKSHSYKNKYLLGSYTGLLIAEFNENKIDTIGYLKDLNYRVRTINEDYFGNIWLGTNEDGLFKTEFTSGINKIASITHYTEENGLPKNFDWIDVCNSYQGTLFSTNKGICRYKYSSNIFVLDTLFGFDFSKGDKLIYPLVEDKNKNIWYSCVYDGQYERKTGALLFNGANKKYIPYTKPFIQLNEYVIESIYPENDSIVWFGSSDALIKYEGQAGEHSESSFPCYIRMITLHNDSNIYLSAKDNILNKNYSIDFSNNTIRFDFSALAFNTFGDIDYQVKLVGFDDEWSDWSKETYKEYTSLVEKEYVFKVRARDIYGNISTDASLAFEVTPPFYRTIYAFIIYIIVFGAIIYLILKLNELRHAKERFSLEKLVEDRTNELAHQKEQTEQLVNKLLPQKAADEIRKTGKAKSNKYEMVTVLFADIQGFTKIAEITTPEELIDHLNKIFVSFDKIITHYNIQKIKTIGDAYMCAGGMPEKDTTNPIEVVLAALEMQRRIKEINNDSKLQLEMRIGIHSGPVVAGVVGSKKLEYDIWGDTVNIASRMESHGQINKVNISEQTHQHVKSFFACQYRGKIEVKFKGELEMHFVHEIKKNLSVNTDRITPNKDFFIKLQFIDFKMIQEDILEKLQKNLPTNLYYHNLKHTINVIYIVEDIAREENVDEEDLLLLKCAALFHDAGFMVSYDNNEKIGAKMAAQTLKKHNFSDEQINTVKRLIIATEMPPKPKDLLEKIICDADLDYLGRPDFIPISQNLFRELFERGKINTIEQWNKMQYKFILNHNYFTTTARRNRDAGKEIVLKELKEMI